MPCDRAEALRAALLAIVGSLAVAAAMFFLSTARAAWKEGMEQASPKVQHWFKSQHNAKGEWCCDKSDGHPFFGAYEINADGSVTLQADQGPHTLPAYMVLDGPNPTGHAVWWFTSARDYCFAPGARS